MRTQDPRARVRRGEGARARLAPEAQAEHGTEARTGPVRVLEIPGHTRVPELVPIRHTKMTASPVAFFRGAAAVMAGDLAGSPVSGLDPAAVGTGERAGTAGGRT